MDACFLLLSSSDIRGFNAPRFGLYNGFDSFLFQEPLLFHSLLYVIKFWFWIMDYGLWVMEVETWKCC